MSGFVFASLAGMVSALDIARHFAIEAGYLVGESLFRRISPRASMPRRWNTARVTRTDAIRVLYVEDDERLARLTLECHERAW